jgi:hypothetical protein
MSHDPEFLGLLQSLLHAPKSGDRIQAARVLGQYVDHLNDEEYVEARDALNSALRDADPMVLMEAMQSLTRYDREIRMIRSEEAAQTDAEDETIHPIEQAVCKLCGRPEALIASGGCERADCPYR